MGPLEGAGGAQGRVGKGINPLPEGMWGMYGRSRRNEVWTKEGQNMTLNAHRPTKLGWQVFYIKYSGVHFCM